MPQIVDRGQFTAPGMPGTPMSLASPQGDGLPNWARSQPGRYSPEQLRILSLPGGPLGPYTNQEVDTMRAPATGGDRLKYAITEGTGLIGLLFGDDGPDKAETELTRELRAKGQSYLADEGFREARGREFKRISEEQDRPVSRARAELGLARDILNLRNAMGDQSMQSQRFQWEQENRKAQELESKQKVVEAKAQREQFDAANLAQVQAYAQGAGKIGKTYSPDTLSAATAMAKVLKPREFQIWSDNLFKAEASGVDTSGEKQKALGAFAEYTQTQLDAEIAESDLELQQVSRELKELSETSAGTEMDQAKLRNRAQMRQYLEEKKMIGLLKKAAAWNPDLGSRSMTQYNQMFAGEDASAWVESKYVGIAEKDFLLRYKRPPQTPEEQAMIAEQARKLSTEGGWEP